MLILLHHIIYLLEIDPYLLASISAFFLLSSILIFAHSISTTTSAGSYPILYCLRIISTILLSIPRENNPFIYCLHRVSLSSIAISTGFSPNNITRNWRGSFTMTKADHCEGGRITKPLSRREKKAARKNLPPGQSPSKFSPSRDTYHPMTHIQWQTTTQMPPCANLAPAAFTKSCGGPDAAA